MKKRKKIITIIIAIIALLLAFICGNTYAKNLSKITGKGTADIASWSFKANENDEKQKTINLKTSKNKTSLGEGKIAPGTSGEFEIKLDTNTSDVGINYIIKFENETKKPTNLKFKYKNQTYNTLEELQQELSGTINADEENKIKNIQIGWEWPYETGKEPQEVAQNDKIDTQDAKQITNYTFDIIVTGTQVAPKK